MYKTLLSGIVVDVKQYYKLLDWKDKNYQLWLLWCNDNCIRDNSINTLTLKEYNKLVKHSKI